MTNADAKLHNDVTFHNSEILDALRLANKSLAIEPVRPAGSVFYNTGDRILYYSDGTQWRRLHGGGAAGDQCLVDDDGDTSVCVDNGGDDDRVVLTAAKTVEITAAGFVGAGVTVTATTGAISLLPVAGQTVIQGATHTGGTISGLTVLEDKDSGTAYSVVQSSSNYSITLPTVGGMGNATPGIFFRFVLTTASSDYVEIRSPAFAAIITGSFDNNGTPVAVNAQAAIRFVATAAVGDTVELQNIDATHWYFTGRTTVTNGMVAAAGP
uniref:Major tropism determinant N-terminal domain-containing protein n=1 Tax=Marseillevirus LCMAC103 TaxID=2506604 RepID=A0A481YU93_9VIRU|nr:MAG: hypothetical protein LCMAC103_02110 [Marseillevirus LCMAC103]